MGAILNRGVNITVSDNDPTELRFVEEGTRLWSALREHLTLRDRLWRELEAWKRGMLAYLKAFDLLNQAIAKKSQKVFGLPISSLGATIGPKLTSNMVRIVRAEVTRGVLEKTPLSLASEVVLSGDRLEYRGDVLAEQLGDREKALQQIATLVDKVNGTEEAEEVAQTYNWLTHSTEKAHYALEDHLLIHYIPGRCTLCKKLGGQ